VSRAILVHPKSAVLVAERAGQLLGFVSTGPGRDASPADLPQLELMALYVRAQVYGEGVGHRTDDVGSESRMVRK